MKIAFCASEAVPFAKTGSLADVCGALPLALEDLNVEIVMILPCYRSAQVSGSVLKNFDQDFDWTTIGENIKVYFVKHDMFLREGLYGDRFGDFPDNLRRFSYYSAKSLELLGKIKFLPDVIHCHDWQTSLIPLLLKANGPKLMPQAPRLPSTVLTVHNISYQGLFPREQMPETGLGWEYFAIGALEFYGQINLLKGGIQFSDLINTVSVTHSREIQTQAFGCGLDGVLRAKADRFCGIVNGLDYKVWNPQGDGHLFKSYSVSNVQDKKINKIKLQEKCHLAKIDKLPLLGFVGRLVEQKGIDLVIKALEKLCPLGFQMVALGVGEPKYETALAEIARRFPSQVLYSPQFDDELAHQIYAGCDLFLMPSRFEPCGIGQMISFKYGAVPLVYKTGGLADMVIDYHPIHHIGSGFVFTKFSEEEFLAAVQRAAKLFAQQPKWQELVQSIMRLNFSWKESAKRYLELYDKALKL